MALTFEWDARKAAESQENVGALLAAKGRVRETKTSEGGEAVVVRAQPMPELFRPKQTPVTPPIPDGGASAGSAGPSSVPGAGGVEPPPPSDPKAGVTSRLLEAKRRAQRK